MLHSRIPQIIAAAPGRAEAIVEKTARDIQGGAEIRARVDTGQMKSGFDVVDASPGGGDPGRAVINPVEHTVHNEFGTSKMGAQPMLVPAAEEAQPGFVAAMKQVYR